MADPQIIAQNIEALVAAAVAAGDVGQGGGFGIGPLRIGGQRTAEQYRNYLTDLALRVAVSEKDVEAVNAWNNEALKYYRRGLLQVAEDGALVGPGQTYTPKTEEEKEGQVTGKTIRVVDPESGALLGYREYDTKGQPIGGLIKPDTAGGGDGALTQYQAGQLGIQERGLAQEQAQFEATLSQRVAEAAALEQNRRAVAIQNAINALPELLALAISNRPYYPGAEPGGLLASMLGGAGVVPVERMAVDPWAAVQAQYGGR